MKTENSARLQANKPLSFELLGASREFTVKRRKKTDTRLIEAMLDFALLAGFISAMGVLVRLAF